MHHHGQGVRPCAAHGWLGYRPAFPWGVVFATLHPVHFTIALKWHIINTGIKKPSAQTLGKAQRNQLALLGNYYSNSHKPYQRVAIFYACRALNIARLEMTESSPTPLIESCKAH